jgi:hypothetical protein
MKRVAATAALAAVCAACSIAPSPSAFRDEIALVCGDGGRSEPYGCSEAVEAVLEAAGPEAIGAAARATFEWGWASECPPGARCAAPPSSASVVTLTLRDGTETRYQVLVDGDGALTVRGEPESPARVAAD